MLNTFPLLISFSLLAPFILRMAVGLFFLKTGLAHLKINQHTGEEMMEAEKAGFLPGAYLVWGIAIIEIIGGGLLIAGAYTQVVSLFFIFLIISILTVLKQKKQLFGYHRNFYLLLLIICISLIFSGAGFLAMDMPL
jgi:uncharacterized membrane protein YphA (DoxX/SURF4 family)